MQVPEQGSASYTVTLATEPNAAVTVDIAAGANSRLTLDHNQLVFAIDDWNQPQTVTVSAAADPDTDDDTAT